MLKGEYMKNTEHGLTSTQRYAAGGFLALIAGTQFAMNYLPRPVVTTLAIGYGIGAATATGLLRFAGLFKNGKAEDISLQEALYAGLAVAFGLTCFYAAPAAVASVVTSEEMGYPATIATGLAGVVAGYFQSRSNFVGTLASEQQR